MASRTFPTYRCHRIPRSSETTSEQGGNHLSRYPHNDRSETDTIHRFWSKVEKTENCWLWTSVLRKGYGRFKVAGHYVSAHRFAYELLVSEIPEGMTIDHVVCADRACVNPDHMEVVTLAENTARSNHKRAGSQCSHPRVSRNIYRHPKTGRVSCRTCRRESNRRWRLRQGG